MKTQGKTLLSVTFRAPAELIRAIDEVCSEHSRRLDLPVDRSAMIRRALSQAFQGKTTNTTAQAGR